MTLLVRDESRLIRENIDYHLSRGVDFIIATDNRSVDETPEILREYEKRGVLRVIYEPGDDYSQGVWVTRMARLAAREHGADWLIHCDADEFWWPETAMDLRSTFRNIPPEIDGIVAERSDFFALRDANPALPFYESMQIRKSHSTNHLGRTLLPKVCHRAREDIVVQQGNHGFSLPHRQAQTVTTNSVMIMHFPLRSYLEFERKIKLGGAAYERNRALPKSVGRTWRVMYEKYLAGTLRQYWDEQAMTPAQLDQFLSTGNAIPDSRLADYFKGLYKPEARLSSRSL